MFPAWTVCAILFASVFGGRAAPFEDNPLVEKVKEIIADVDEYIASQNLNELRIPDIDLPLSPIKIRNGGFGDLSSIFLKVGDSSITEKKLEDNSTVYRFKRFHYDFEVNTFMLKRTGNFSISAQNNDFQVSGFAVVGSDNTCEAELTSLLVLDFGKYKIELQPNDFPEATTLSEKILTFTTAFLVPFTDAALDVPLALPQVQQKFSEFACKKITNL